MRETKKRSDYGIDLSHSSFIINIRQVYADKMLSIRDLAFRWCCHLCWKCRCRVKWSWGKWCYRHASEQSGQCIPKSRPTRNARPNHIHLVGRGKNKPILTDKYESSNKLRGKKSRPFPWDITMSYGNLLQLFGCFCLNLSISVREIQADQTSTNLLANFLLAFRASLLNGP